LVYIEGKTMNQAESPRHSLVTSLTLGKLLTGCGFQPRVWAAEFATGLYPLGYQSSLSGYLPAPGFYLRNDFYVYRGNAKIVPFSQRIEVSLRSRFIADLVAATYVTPLEIFGAHYAAGIIWSSVANNFLKGRLQVNTGFPVPNHLLSRAMEGSYTRVSDLVVTPVNLGWHLGQRIKGSQPLQWAVLFSNAEPRNLIANGGSAQEIITL
jgi:hypothetical protein